MNDTHFDVFLSHNSRDKPAVERLAVKLTRDGLEPWLDKWHLTPGGRWQEELAAGIRACASCAVFVGPHGIGDWVHEELGMALDRAAKDRGFRLFLVLLPGLREPFDPSALPPFLSTRTWVDLRSGIEDARAYQHLINAIKGVPFGQQMPSEPNTDVCPYRGLQTFHEEHADLFFGRGNDVQRLLEKLKWAPFLAVLGPSGSGKSSLVRAGLIPALRRGALPGSEQWAIRAFTPGAHPLTALAAQLVQLYPQEAMHRTLDALAADPRTLHLAVALAHAGQPGQRRVVWVVDQFEEVFTLCQDDAERAAFLANLLYATPADGYCTVVLTMRADFYPKCAAYPDLAARISAQQFLVSPMSLDALRAAIQEPAWQAGLEFEQGLVDTILADVSSQPGALPLLEHALLELWERRRGRLLTLEGYRESGGVHGAIAKRADTIYSNLGPAEQQIARETLQRLTQPGEGTEDTRRRAALSELMTQSASSSAVEAVVRELVDARLLITNEDAASHQNVIEVSHEALIRGWPRLRAWLDEDRAGLRILRRLTEASAEWELLRQDVSLLYRGARLAEALEWRAQHQTSLNDQERTFLDASVAHATREEEAAEARRQKELDDARRLAAIEQQHAQAARALAHSEQRRARVARILSSGLAAVLVVALVTAGLAVQQRGQAQIAQHVAEQQRGLAEAARRTAVSRELATNATAQLAIDPEVSLLLAREAVRQAPTGAALDALRTALTESHVRMALRPRQGVLYSASFSPDGRDIVTAGAGGAARLWDARTGRLLAVLSGHHGNVVAGYSPNGRVIATIGLDDGVSRLWDARDGRLLAVLHGHRGGIFSAAFSRDSRELATAGADGTARVWSVPDGRPLLVQRGSASGTEVTSVAFSPDGRTIVSGSSDTTASIWDARSGRVMAMLRGHTDIVGAVAYSPNGLYIATASYDGSARIWSARDGHVLSVLTGHRGIIYTATFSPDSSLLLTAGADGTARVWSVPGGAAPRWGGELFGHTGKVFSATFSPDGRLVVTASADGTARIWTTGLGQTVAMLRGHSKVLASAAFSPDGSRVVTASLDGTARVWETGTGRIEVGMPARDGCLAANATLHTFNALVFSPDGRWQALPGDDCLTRIVDARSGRVVALLRGHSAVVQTAVFSPDGTRLVTGSEDYTARVWETRTWRSVQILRGSAGSVNGAAYSPDGRVLVTANADGTLRWWDTATWRALRVRRWAGGVLISARFSPDGRWIVTGSFDHTVIVWSARDGAQVRTLRDHSDSVTSVAFNPAGTRLATAGRDGTVIIYDTRTWQQVITLHGAAAVTSVGFSPDGAWLVTGSFDGSAKVWEAASAQWPLIATLEGPANGVYAVTFSPDGQAILIAGIDGTARVYPCDVCGSTAALLARAQSRVTRDLTPAERTDYLYQGTGA